MAVELYIFGTRLGLGRLLRAVLREVGVLRGEWTVKVVGDEEMTELHGRMMGIWTTTDVLTFDLREKQEARSKKHVDGEGTAIELDTVVCVDEARRRAKEMGHRRGRVREELLLYCVHSLLHVQGYDDVTADKAKRMHAREDEILEAIGVGVVYAAQIRNPKPEIRKSKIKNQRSGGRA